MECFGDSSSDEEEEGSSSVIGASTIIQRDESSCGVCSFHPNTEASLLTHVRNALKKSTSPTSPTSSPPTTSSSTATTMIDEKTKIQRSTEVLRAIDEFCMSRHWMMHVGPSKGEILLTSLREAMENKKSNSNSNSNPKQCSFVLVELGTYCGYASILMGRAILESESNKLLEDDGDDGGGDDMDDMACHLITTEINREYAEIATEMIRLCGMDDFITVTQISYDGHDTDLVRSVRESLKTTIGEDAKQQQIDFLFIDHDKDSYKSDLIKLESSGMICRGTKVVADNVLFANIHDYRTYVRERANDGIVTTRTIECYVEYSGDGDVVGNSNDVGTYTDGVEITDYLLDP